jgi:hypothetical protein
MKPLYQYGTGSESLVRHLRPKINRSQPYRHPSGVIVSPGGARLGPNLTAKRVFNIHIVSTTDPTLPRR